MAVALAATPPQLGNPAGGEVAVDRMPLPSIAADDLTRRQAASRRLGWILGAVVVAIYVVGLFIKR